MCVLNFINFLTNELSTYIVFLKYVKTNYVFFDSMLDIFTALNAIYNLTSNLMLAFIIIYKLIKKHYKKNVLQ